MNGFGARLRISAVAAPAKLASASPASKVTVRLARRPATATSAAIDSVAPRMAATGTANDVTGAKPNAITSAAAAAAACGAPNSAGSASGLRSSPCSAAPDSPSVAPISAGEQRARQADVAHDDAGRPVAGEQPGDRGARRQPRRPDRERQDRQRHDQRRESQFDGKAAFHAPFLQALRSNGN